MELDYLALFVSDVERAARFYRDVLGFSFPLVIPATGVEGRSGNLRIGLYHQDWRPRLLGERGHTSDPATQAAPAFLLSMTVADLDAVYAQLCQAQVEIWQPPQVMPWGQRLCFFADPDGNWLEVVERSNAAVPAD